MIITFHSLGLWPEFIFGGLTGRTDLEMNLRLMELLEDEFNENLVRKQPQEDPVYDNCPPMSRQIIQ
jgi:hypothetical protein